MHLTLEQVQNVFALKNIYWVALYPLIAAFIIIIGRGFKLYKMKEPSMLLTVFATFLGLVHTCFAASKALELGHGAIPTLEVNIPWIVTGGLTFSVGYLFDSMSLMMLFVVTFISLLIQIYTHGYMEKDPGYSKFFAYLALFNFSMLGLVLSTNLFQIYIFWEMVGVCSYLLIGFWFTRPAAGKACVKAFLMNRVGDFGLLVGILTFLFVTFQWWNTQYLVAHPDQALLSFQGFSDAAHFALNAVGPWPFALIAIFIFMGPMAKSAQVPLHTWLPDAMEGPTPISALIHAATMVAAGVYLVGRVYPVFAESALASQFVTVIGVLTAFIAATIALTQMDIKKALAYSTVSQLGFMMVGMGVGAFTAGLFHLFTHAFFKAMLFLGSGSVIHAVHDEQDMRHMGGLAKYLPATHWTYLIGTLAISAALPFSGFWSKDEILVGALSQPFIFLVLALTAGLTSFYMFRTYFLTFTGEYRGHHEPHHESKVMTIPLMILAIPSIAIGFYLSGHVEGWPSFEQFIHFGAAHEGGEGHHAPILLFGINMMEQIGFLPLVAWISWLIGVAGFVVAYLFYNTKVPFVIENSIKSAIPGVYRFFEQKWCFDEAYQSFVDKGYLNFANHSANFDKNRIDGLVNWTGQTVMSSGQALKQLQNGKVQLYIAVLFYSVCVLSLLLMYLL
ncbi:MAG: NADH-quinone oxidoreductase subunit L [Cyanobacteria bacterium]|nr:NADH-quinone oxidoreductase subunit L [Cyanobacteriota bacterium]